MKNFTDKELARFNQRIEKSGACWLWTGPLDRDGYGHFYFRGATRVAHRVSYYALYGEIPEGMVINHVCRNKNCVNPQHLQCVTPRENALKDSSSLAYINSQKTTCPEGHPFDKVVNYSGKIQRVCSICDNARRTEYKRRRYQEAKKNLRV